MIRLKKYGRLWNLCRTEQMLSSWAENPENISGILIKKNRNRAVWRVCADDGKTYFVKREKKFRFPFIASKAEKEFSAFALLKEKGIPAAECTAWSATMKDSILVTAALPDDYISIAEYWYSKPETDLEFLHHLCVFLKKIAQSGIRHPDFHAGNLMTNGKEIVMIDPVGIEATEESNTPQSWILIPLMTVLGDIPRETIVEMLHTAGVYPTVFEAETMLEKMKKQQYELIEREWEKRQKQILSGTSKFATETGPGKFLRNSAWFSPGREYSENMLETTELPEPEARELWLNSFRCQLMKTKCDIVPVIYEIKGKNGLISVLKDKKALFFYGFR